MGTTSHARRGHIFQRLCNPSELEKAWLEVLAHYPKDRLPGDLRQFEQRRAENLEKLARELNSRSFIPEPAALIHIPKPGKPGEQRLITLTKPADRIVLTALNRLLEPLFECRFAERSFAYRKGRSALQAVERVETCLRWGLEHVAGGDIHDFFPSINRAKLREQIARVIWEEPILELIDTYLYMGATQQLEWIESARGIAQGSPLSPLLSNVYLLPFDRFLDSLGTEWVRYADNFILLAQDPTLAQDAFHQAEAFLAEQCDLRLNADSRFFACAGDGFDFLGFHFRAGRRVMSPAKFEQKKLALAEHLRRHRDDLQGLVEELRETILGWRAYYGSSPDTREQMLRLQQHLFELLVPWLGRYRAEGPGKDQPATRLKTCLMQLELPADSDPRRKLKWVELLLARSRPEAANLSVRTQRAIAKRQRQYRKMKLDLQQILISRPGTYLGRRGERLLVRRHGQRSLEVPLSLVRGITLTTTAASLSAELMAEAAARGIAIHILGASGRPAVRIGPIEAPLYQLTLAQARLASCAEGLELARAFVVGKIQNQINLLRYYAKYPKRRRGPEYLENATAATVEMEQIREQTARRTFSADLELERGRLFAAEGQAASSYWRAVKALLWQPTGFEGRVRKGARDPVNSLLNYGYGILYSKLLGVLVRVGLNVTIGFLHKPAPGKPALLFDFMEEFRVAAVDRVVFSMLNWGKRYAVTPEGLAEPARRDLARQILRRLSSPVRYAGTTVPLEEVMQHQAQCLVRAIEGKQSYQPFVLPW